MAAPSYPRGLYSRFVGYLKIALPLLAVGLLSTVFLLQEEDTIRGGITFSADDRDTIRDGLTVYEPKFAGVNLNGDRFYMEAAKATPDSADPDEIVLVDLDGRTDYTDGASVYLTAARAIARIPEQVLELSGGVRIRTSDGFEGLTNSGVAALDTGTFITDGPVTLEGAMGILEAGSMRLDRLAGNATTAAQNQVFTFENGVKLTLDPK